MNSFYLRDFYIENFKFFNTKKHFSFQNTENTLNIQTCNGGTSQAMALFDAASNLFQINMTNDYKKYHLNHFSEKDCSSFEYQFYDEEYDLVVVYKYTKKDNNCLIKESLSLSLSSGELINVFSIDRDKSMLFTTDVPSLKTLRNDLTNNPNINLLNYVRCNSNITEEMIYKAITSTYDYFQYMYLVTDENTFNTLHIQSALNKSYKLNKALESKIDPEFKKLSLLFKACNLSDFNFFELHDFDGKELYIINPDGKKVNFIKQASKVEKELVYLWVDLCLFNSFRKGKNSLFILDEYPYLFSQFRIELSTFLNKHVNQFIQIS